ncbi:MAG: hypothetical protein ABIM46_04640 [candidate division WOR-3 bacterium]
MRNIRKVNMKRGIIVLILMVGLRVAYRPSSLRSPGIPETP